MRILHIINSLNTGGAEKLILDTLPLYNLKGVNVDVLIFKSGESPFLKQLKAEKCCNIIELDFKNVYNPLIIFKLIKYLKDYDVAHVHLFPALYFVAIANVFLKNKCKLIFTEHSTSNRRIESRFFKPLDYFIYNKYTKIVCITENVKDIIKNYINLGNNRLLVIENGVDIKKVATSKPIEKTQEISNKINKNDKLIIQVSSFHNPKDQITVIKSLLLLPKYIKLLLVGSGVDLNISLDLVANLNLKNRVFFLGNRLDVPSLLKTSDVVVLSSKYEGLSLSSIEAMASGKPFIASNVPGLREVVKDAGVLFEQGNSKQLAKEIEELLEDVNYYNDVVNTCQQRAKQFDISLMVDKHIKLYNSML